MQECSCLVALWSLRWLEMFVFTQKRREIHEWESRRAEQNWGLTSSVCDSQMSRWLQDKPVEAVPRVPTALPCDSPEVFFSEDIPWQQDYQYLLFSTSSRQFGPRPKYACHLFCLNLKERVNVEGFFFLLFLKLRVCANGDPFDVTINLSFSAWGLKYPWFVG